MTSDDAEGTTETAACRFWMVSFTVTRRPFYFEGKHIARLRAQFIMHTQSPVALAMSSPTFLGDSPRGPIFGASADEAPTSPPVARSVLHQVSEVCCRPMYSSHFFNFLNKSYSVGILQEFADC